MISLKRMLGLLLILLLPCMVNAQFSAPELTNSNPPPTANAPLTSNSYTFKQLGWDSAVTLNGYKPDATLYLPLAKRLGIKKASLHLLIDYSAKLATGSRVDINFNQALLSSLALAADATQKINLDLELPVAQFSEDWQVLDFSAFLNSSTNLCSPELWIYISPDSTITIDREEKPFNGSLNQLPAPFIEPAPLAPIANNLLLLASPSAQELHSLLQIAFNLGSKANDAQATLSSQVLSERTTDLQQGNLILVATAAHLLASNANEFKNLLQSDDIRPYLQQNKGMLLLNQSPFNPLQGLLIVSGADDRALANASQTLFRDEFNRIASGKVAFINKAIATLQPNTNYEYYETTLKELGYTNKNVSGLGRHSLIFNLPLPNDQIPDQSSIETFITTPIFAKDALSQLTLLVNDQKQASFWLNEEHSAWKTAVDPSALKPGLNKLEYLIDLHFENNGYERCSRANYDEVWATIYAQTKINVSFSREQPRATLNQLPVPFTHEIVAVIPQQADTDSINLFTQFFFKLGQLFQSSPLQLSIYAADQVNEEFIRNHNVIILGTTQSNPWVTYALNYMPMQLKGNSRYLNLPEQQLQVSGDTINGLMELLPSPWSEGHTVLLITGNNQNSLEKTIHAFIHDKVRQQLDGNIALINADQTVTTLNSNDNRYLSPQHRLMMYLSNLGKNIYYYLSHHPQVFIYILVFLVPLIIVKRKRRK